MSSTSAHSSSSLMVRVGGSNSSLGGGPRHLRPLRCFHAMHAPWCTGGSRSRLRCHRPQTCPPVVVEPCLRMTAPWQTPSGEMAVAAPPPSLGRTRWWRPNARIVAAYSDPQILDTRNEIGEPPVRDPDQQLCGGGDSLSWVRQKPGNTRRSGLGGHRGD
jgi:hypothetical protein